MNQRDRNLVYMETDAAAPPVGVYNSAGAYEWKKLGRLGNGAWAASCCGGLYEGLPKEKANATVVAEIKDGVVFACFVGHGRGGHAAARTYADGLVPGLRAEVSKAALASLLATLDVAARKLRKPGDDYSGATGTVVIFQRSTAVVASLGAASCLLSFPTFSWRSPPLAKTVHDLFLDGADTPWNHADFTVVDLPSTSEEAVFRCVLASRPVVEHVGFARICEEVKSKLNLSSSPDDLETLAHRMSAIAEQKAWANKFDGLIEDLSILIVQIALQSSAPAADNDSPQTPAALPPAVDAAPPGNGSDDKKNPSPPAPPPPNNNNLGPIEDDDSSEDETVGA